MNERDKELENQCYVNGAYLDAEKFADFIRADEREACALIVENEAIQYAEPVWALEIVNDIRARMKS